MACDPTKPVRTGFTDIERPTMTNRLIAILLLSFIAISSAFFLSSR
jgi:Flp pilus assembly protein protease CpaA